MRSLLACLAISLATASTLWGADNHSRFPNILILYADDLGYGDLSGQNPKSKISTPNLDRLAQQGMRFTDGHSSSGICSPSRYARLAGRHHWRDFHGIVNAFGPSVFKPERLTMPEMLKRKGYATTCIGKWHLGWNWDALRNEGRKAGNTPEDFDLSDAGYATLGTGKLIDNAKADNQRMFDRHFNPEQRWSPFTGELVRYTKEELPSKKTDNPRHVIIQKEADPVVLPLNGLPSDRNPDQAGGESFDWGPIDVPDAAMGDTQITDWAIKELQSKFDNPFFLCHRAN